VGAIEDYIVSDPKVMMGKPVIRGTRITVELILDALAAGETIEQLLESYPFLTETSIRAALAFGARALRASVVYPTAS
jgi:uncharacterized protein (DUF433 family)